MEIKIATGVLERVIKQRNLFLLLTILLAAAALLNSVVLINSKQRIVMVPGLSREMSITDSGVSSSYLEEMSMMFLSHLLNISKNDIMHKRDAVLKYTSHSGNGYFEAINEYFSNAEAEYTRFDLTTNFTTKNLEINPSTLTVIANGVLTSWFGIDGYKTKEASYKLTFEYSGGFLRLKEFSKVVEENK